MMELGDKFPTGYAMGEKWTNTSTVLCRKCDISLTVQCWICMTVDPTLYRIGGELLMKCQVSCSYTGQIGISVKVDVFRPTKDKV